MNLMSRDRQAARDTNETMKPREKKDEKRLMETPKTQAENE